MGEPFLSEIRIVSFNFPPRGWAFCNGQLLPINQNQALFSLLGTTYGGDGRVNFALPNMQGCAPIHRGNGYTLGEHGGQIAHTLTSQEMPAHTHMASAGSVEGDSPVPTGNLLATSANPIYTTASNLVTLNAASVTAVGGSQPHSNMQPYLVLNFIIALQGIFPSQN